MCGPRESRMYEQYESKAATWIDSRLRRAYAALALARLGLLCGCSGTLDLGSDDAGVPYDADCKAGTYAGDYNCGALSDSAFEFSLKGPIAVTLVPIGGHTLGLTPDAALSSATSGTSSISTLTGVLDCPTRKLGGSFGPVAFTSASFNGTFNGEGVFSATYDPDASPPLLIDGIMDPPAPLALTCTWTAQLE
jgi:hypothetical protein